MLQPSFIYTALINASMDELVTSVMKTFFWIAIVTGLKVYIHTYICMCVFIYVYHVRLHFVYWHVCS